MGRGSTVTGIVCRLEMLSVMLSVKDEELKIEIFQIVLYLSLEVGSHPGRSGGK